jgi:hypothetical protein
MKPIDKLIEIARSSVKGGDTESKRNPSLKFTQHIEKSVHAISGVALLAKQRRRVGFVPIGFSDYVQSLAKAVQVDLQIVLAQFGLENLDEDLSKNMPKIAKLSKSIGLNEYQTFIQICIMVLKKIDLQLDIPLQPMRARGVTEINEDESIKHEIDKIIDTLNSKDRQQFQIMQNAIHTTFQD